MKTEFKTYKSGSGTRYFVIGTRTPEGAKEAEELCLNLVFGSSDLEMRLAVMANSLPKLEYLNIRGGVQSYGGGGCTRTGANLDKFSMPLWSYPQKLTSAEAMKFVPKEFWETLAGTISVLLSKEGFEAIHQDLAGAICEWLTPAPMFMSPAMPEFYKRAETSGDHIKTKVVDDEDGGFDDDDS